VLRWTSKVAPNVGNLVVAGSSDGNMFVALGWNAGIRWGRAAICSG
jgi:hypothetical protein